MVKNNDFKHKFNLYFSKRDTQKKRFYRRQCKIKGHQKQDNCTKVNDSLKKTKIHIKQKLPFFQDTLCSVLPQAQLCTIIVGTRTHLWPMWINSSLVVVCKGISSFSKMSLFRTTRDGRVKIDGKLIVAHVLKQQLHCSISEGLLWDCGYTLFDFTKLQSKDSCIPNWKNTSQSLSLKKS